MIVYEEPLCWHVTGPFNKSRWELYRVDRCRIAGKLDANKRRKERTNLLWHKPIISQSIPKAISLLVFIMWSFFPLLQYASWKTLHKPNILFLFPFVLKSLWRSNPLQHPRLTHSTIVAFLNSLIQPGLLSKHPSWTCAEPFVVQHILLLCLVEMSGDYCDERPLIFTAAFM